MILTLVEEELPTPIGGLLLIADPQGALRAAEWSDGRERLPRLLNRQYGTQGYALAPGAVAAALRQAMRDYFDGRIDALESIEVNTSGTAFQTKVWAALRTIPPGRPISYDALGRQLGFPSHARAIGHANAANPVNIVIPCHRLVGTNGTLTGYAGGLERKRWLLAHERAIGAATTL